MIGKILSKNVLNADGEWECKLLYSIDGQGVSAEAFGRAFPDQPLGDGSGLVGWKPLASDALAVHPGQRGEAIEDSRKKGVPTHFLEDGRPVFESRQHRRNYMRAYGFFDKQAGYSDAQRGDFLRR